MIIRLYGGESDRTVYQCSQCPALTTGKTRVTRTGWRGWFDKLSRRYVPLCVDCAEKMIRASRGERP